SDAVLTSGSLAALVATLDRDGGVGIVAPVALDANGNEQVDSYGRFPTLWTLLTRRNRSPRSTVEPDWVSGVAMLVRRDEFLARGGFDPAFWMYYEDVDLCRRYREAGQRVVRDAAATVVHISGGSRGDKRRHFRAYFRSQDA